MKRFQMARNAAKNTAEILIYDVIGEDFFSGGVSAKSFVDDLKSLGDVQTIDVRINSPGGSVPDGFAIYNALVRHPATVNVHIDGIAFSAASWVAQAGDTIEAAANSMLMIHRAESIAMGNAEEFMAQASTLEKLDGQLADIYAARSGKPKQNFLDAMAAETYYTANEALAAGLVTSVGAAKKVAACAVDLGWFRHPPEAVRNLVRPLDNHDQSRVAALRRKHAMRMRILELDDAA